LNGTGLAAYQVARSEDSVELPAAKAAGAHHNCRCRAAGDSVLEEIGHLLGDGDDVGRFTFGAL